MEFKHISVLFGESIDALNIKPNGIYADGTLGGGGHSHGILSTNDSCRLIGIDQDKEAIAAAKERLKEFDGRVTFVIAISARLRIFYQNLILMKLTVRYLIWALVHISSIMPKEVSAICTMPLLT